MVEIPDEVQYRLDELKKAVTQSGIYADYEKCRQELLCSPEMFEAMNRFRQENYTMNTRRENGSGMEPEVRSMLLDRVAMHTNPAIGKYLDAELEVCLLLRKILCQIGTLADLQLDSFGDAL